MPHTVRPVLNHHLAEIVINLQSYPKQNVPNAFAYIDNWHFTGTLDQLYQKSKSPTVIIDAADGTLTAMRLDDSYKTVDYSFKSQLKPARKGRVHGKA